MGKRNNILWSFLMFRDNAAMQFRDYRGKLQSISSALEGGIIR